MTAKEVFSPAVRDEGGPAYPGRFMAVARSMSGVCIIAAIILLVYSTAWYFSTRRYLTGFADAIVPLSGSPEEKTEALAKWFQHEPRRLDIPVTGSGGFRDRDPVDIVQDMHLLRICGSASNAFMNLGEAAGLKVRRLLLLDESGRAKHVVVEVNWGDRWIVVDPRQGRVFKDHLGRALTKEDLRAPEVFRDAIGQMPGYNPMYTFDRTVHLRLSRIPILGASLRRALDRFAPGWEEATNWTYVRENPSLWMVFVSFPLLLLGIVGYLAVNTYRGSKRGLTTSGLRK